MISEKDYNGIYLKGYEDGKNDNNNLEIHYEIKPSFTTRKIKELQQERDLYKEVIEEVRKVIDTYKYVENDDGMYEPILDGYDIQKLLQILDKVIGDDK